MPNVKILEGGSLGWGGAGVVCGGNYVLRVEPREWDQCSYKRPHSAPQAFHHVRI